jgi:single-strand DNA-binding protein
VAAASVQAEVIAMTTTETNRLVLTGRLTTDPQVRELPSGDDLVTFRLSVPRAPTPGVSGSRRTHDWFDCAVWGGRARVTALAWQAGDTVRLEGALRRRFFAGAAGAQTRVEVEVLAGRRLARATEGDRRQSRRAAPQ